MKRDVIVEWKFQADDGRTRVAEALVIFVTGSSRSRASQL
jgi:hypothetical protein